MTDSTAILGGTDIESAGGSGFDAPVLAHPFETSGHVGLRRSQTGDDPNHLHLPAARAKFANEIDPPVTRFDSQVLRGKMTPE